MALTLYKSVHVLIQRRLPDPAQLLARTLLEDGIRLAYFRLYPARLEVLAVRWTIEALTEEQSLQVAAQPRVPRRGEIHQRPERGAGRPARTSEREQLQDFEAAR